MSESQVSRDAPEVALSLELHSSLNRFIEPDGPLIEAVRAEISRGLAGLLSTLGIPGTPAVRIGGPQTNPMRAGDVVRVYVNSQPCRYPDELLQRVHSYVNEVHLDPAARPGFILAWLSELAEGKAEADDVARGRFVDFLNLVCLEAIKRQPAILLHRIQAEAYVASLPVPKDESHPRPERWPPESAWLLPILGEVLDLRISIADKHAVAEVLASGQHRSRKAVVEDLIAVLRRDIVDIEVSPEYLRQVTTFDPENGPGMFTFLRDSMFSEVGLAYPPFRFVPNERLKPNSFAFKINHLTTLPWIGLQPDQCLVNATKSSLDSIDIQAIGAGYPASKFEGSIIHSSHRSLAEAAGLTTWTQPQYLILCFADILRENGPCFVHRGFVQYQLEQLSYGFPALVETFRPEFSVQQTTRLLRALVSEGIPIRDMRLILERLLDHRYWANDAERYLVLDDRVSSSGHLQKGHADDLLSFLRAGLKRQICNKYARGTSTIVVYLVDPKLENLFDGADRNVVPDEDRQERLIAALASEIDHLPPTAQTPSILTTVGVRAALRDAIKSTFPRVGVLAYQELVPDVNVQPVARVSSS
jgi:hypothetical protein